MAITLKERCSLIEVMLHTLNTRLIACKQKIKYFCFLIYRYAESLVRVQRNRCHVLRVKEYDVVAGAGLYAASLLDIGITNRRLA